MSARTCTASRFGRHDYSLPPHSTPDSPTVPGGDEPCQAQSAAYGLGPCLHTAEYVVVVYQIATHEWVQLDCCWPCAATIQKRHSKLGPGGTQGVHSIKSLSRKASS